VQGDAVLYGFNMCILIMKVSVAGGLDGGIELVLHGAPELLSRFRSEFEKVRQLATATKTSCLQLLAKT
jgi:hypothetical protein